MRKYTAGGRCDGHTSKIKEDTQGVTSAFSELIEKRKGLDTLWSNPPIQQPEIKKSTDTSIPFSMNQAVQIFKVNPIEQRKKDIDLLLED